MAQPLIRLAPLARTNSADLPRSSAKLLTKHCRLRHSGAMSPVGSGSLESLREQNRRRLLDMLRRHGSASRAELARLTGLSRSTVSTLVADLQASGLLDRARAGPPSTQQGRPPTLLTFDRSAGLVLGIDFGHEHVHVAIADLSRTILAEEVRELDVDESAARALDAAVEMTAEVIDAAEVENDRILGIGVGLSGPIDVAAGSVHSGKILPGWAGVRPADELAARLGPRRAPRQRREPRRARRGHARRRHRRARRDLPDGLRRRRRGPDPRRRAVPRQRRHGRRARPRARRRERPDLSLRQPRLPGDDGRRPRDPRPAAPQPRRRADARRRHRAVASRATPARAARSPTPAASSAARSRRSSTPSTQSWSSSAAGSVPPATSCSIPYGKQSTATPSHRRRGTFASPAACWATAPRCSARSSLQRVKPTSRLPRRHPVTGTTRAKGSHMRVNGGARRRSCR